jgi:hypothetical protein
MNSFDLLTEAQKPDNLLMISGPDEQGQPAEDPRARQRKNLFSGAQLDRKLEYI